MLCVDLSVLNYAYKMYISHVSLDIFTVQSPQSTSVTRSTMVSPSIPCAIDTMARQRTDIRKYQSLERFQEDTFNASYRVIF